MKQNNVFKLFVLASTVLLAACEFGANSNSKSIPSEDSSVVSSVTTSNEDNSSVINTSSVEDKSSSISETTSASNEKILLVAPTNTSQLTDNCKQYVDAMRKQQKDIADDYKWNDLKGNAGVEVTDYKDKSGQSPKSDNSLGVTLTFTNPSNQAGLTYKIKYSMDNNLANAKEVSANPNGTTIKNLYAGKDYYYQVVASNGQTSDVAKFTTGDYPRWIDCDKVFNVRDMGGYMTSYGKRVKQGLIYRGGEITTKEWGSDHALTYTEEGKRIFREEMGVKNEIDFRNGSQRGDGCNSCWFANNGDIAYTNIQMVSFSNALNQNQSLIKQLFENFANADQKPVYFHCHGGADRTGTAGFLLLSVLGVSYTDVVIDYELTCYSSIKGGDCERSHKRAGTYNDWPGMINTLKNMTDNSRNKIWNDNASLKDNVEAYLTKKCNISSQTISKLREIMIEK